MGTTHEFELMVYVHQLVERFSQRMQLLQVYSKSLFDLIFDAEIQIKVYFQPNSFLEQQHDQVVLQVLSKDQAAFAEQGGIDQYIKLLILENL